MSNILFNLLNKQQVNSVWAVNLCGGIQYTWGQQCFVLDLQAFCGSLRRRSSSNTPPRLQSYKPLNRNPMVRFISHVNTGTVSRWWFLSMAGESIFYFGIFFLVFTAKQHSCDASAKINKSATNFPLKKIVAGKVSRCRRGRGGCGWWTDEKRPWYNYCLAEPGSRQTSNHCRAAWRKMTLFYASA